MKIARDSKKTKGQNPSLGENQANKMQALHILGARSIYITVSSK
jgi:hypothetical protein